MGDRRRHRRGRKLLIAAALGPFCAAAADLPVREVVSQATWIGHGPLPGFQHGYLFLLQDATVRLFSPQGNLAFSRALSIAAGTTPTADGLAVDSDGSVAVGVEYGGPAGHAGGIVFLDRNGRDAGFIDTGLYMPSALSFAEDHSLWTFGWRWDSARPDVRSSADDYMLVRHYTADRNLAGRYLSRALFPGGSQPGTPDGPLMRLAISHDKVGLLAWSGASVEWVELDLNGNLIRRVRVNGVGQDGMAFTADGHLYNELSDHRLQMLRTGSPDWQSFGPSPGPILLGGDGNLLVFAEGGAGPLRLQWFAQPTSKGP